MNVLVTGGGGFIGGHLVDRLLKDGYHVMVLDTFRRGTREYQKYKSHPALRYRKADLAFASSHVLQTVLREIDYVFHCAGKSGSPPSFKNPALYHQANVTATVNLLEACRYSKIKKFIFSATSPSSNSFPVTPLSETARVRLTSPYFTTKYVAELCVLYWYAMYKVPVVSLRLFNVYGPQNLPGRGYGSIVTTFIEQKIQGLPLTVRGRGDERRDFVHIDDIVDVMLLAAKSPYVGEIFNIGSGKSTSLSRLASLIGGSIDPIVDTRSEGFNTRANIAKAKKCLGWNPRVSIEEGVRGILNSIHVD